MNNETIPWMIRGYLRGRNSAFGRPVDTSDAGAAGLVKFGKQLFLMGAGLLVLCVFLPSDGRRSIFFGMAIATCLAGLWHIANAQAIVRHARDAIRHTREI